MTLRLAGVLAITLVTVNQEIDIGRQANQEVRSRLRELKDPEVTAWLRDVGQRLVKTAPGEKYPYSFSVADYRELNAFALPGGPVWIHRGVLQAAATESQAASVVAHEITHIAERHAASRLSAAMVTKMGLGLLGAMLGNSGGAIAAQGAASLMANGMFLKFSRDDEREADRVGLAMMRRAGWDGRGMVELFETLRRQAERDPDSVEVFFSSHPSPQNRIADLRAALPRANQGRRDSQRFQQIRRRLQQLPPARVLPSTTLGARPKQ